MNFTHLLPNAEEPSQEDLQRFEHYMVIVALSDEMQRMMLDAAALDLKSTDDVLCQIVRPLDLAIAPPGSLLERMKTALQANPRAPQQLEHSFIATASRKELTSHPMRGGKYLPLHLNTLATLKEQQAELRMAIANAVERAEAADRDREMSKVLKAVASAASFVGSIFRLSGGSPM